MDLYHVYASAAPVVDLDGDIKTLVTTCETEREVMEAIRPLVADRVAVEILWCSVPSEPHRTGRAHPPSGG